MNRKFGIQLVATLAWMFMLSSCTPPSESPEKRTEAKDEAEISRQQPPINGVIESVHDLKAELAEVTQGKNGLSVLESALMHSRRLDESAAAWDGTSISLATQFSDLSPGGNPGDEFFEKFGLAGRDSNTKPKVEVEVLVKTIGMLASARPDLLQELLVKKSSDLTQTESDLVVYVAALELVMEYSSVFRRIGYDGIISLRESENPVYRLLAAKLMPVLEHDLHLLSEFYRTYMAEKDETILLAAIDGLTSAGTSEALGMLQEIAATDREGSSNVVASAKRGVELINARQPDN